MVARTHETTANGAFGVSPYTLEDAWALTARLSPRAVVRVAARDASGEILNQYDRLWPTDEHAPSTTWAMLLADEDLLYRYLCFDFDSSAGNAARDSSRMSYWLTELNIPHLVCISGPTGGRHIWVHLGNPADADTVHDLALYMKDILPSLDVQPLVNAKSGCVRPPCAPHRVAGYSEPQGDLRAITDQEAGPDAVADLIAMFVDLGAELPAPNTAFPHGVVEDADGRPRIRGAKRALSPRMDAVLHGPAGADASHTLARILIAAANARWAYSDVVALIPIAPGLEHARTRRSGAERVPRIPRDTEKVLTALWKYAVTFVATNPISGDGDDPDYRRRLVSVQCTVEAALARADALPGLWSTHNRRVGGTHSQRVVLDALCLYMLQSSQHVVEADVRRLSADTGYGRTTVHTALLALAAEGVSGPAWVERIGMAEGVNAQRYRLHSRFSTEDWSSDRTQARMRAKSEPHALNQSLIRTIGTRLALLAHDVFCAPRSLGRTAGLVFKHLPDDGFAPIGDLVMSTGIAPELLRRRLHTLTRVGLAVRVDDGWRRQSPESRDFIARQLDVQGFLTRRRVAYEVERKVWAWWLAEITWMERRGKRRRGRKPSRDAWFSTPDRKEYAAYPRGPSRMGDHAKAAELVRAGYLDRGFVMAAA